MKNRPGCLGKPMDALEDLLQARHSLLDSGIQEVLISLGGKDTLFLNQKGSYLAEALTVPVRSIVGTGDSMVSPLHTFSPGLSPFSVCTIYGSLSSPCWVKRTNQFNVSLYHAYHCPM